MIRYYILGFLGSCDGGRVLEYPPTPWSRVSSGRLRGVVPGVRVRVWAIGCGLMSRVSLRVIALVIATGGTSGPEGYPEVLAPGIPEKPDRAAQCGQQASSLVEISLLAVRRVSTAGHPGRAPRGAGGFVSAWGLGAELSGGWV